MLDGHKSPSSWLSTRESSVCFLRPENIEWRNLIRSSHTNVCCPIHTPRWYLCDLLMSSHLLFYIGYLIICLFLKWIFVILLFYVLHNFCLLSYARIYCAFRVSSLIEVPENSSHEGRLLQELNSLHVLIFLWTLSFLSIIYRISRGQIAVLFWLSVCTNKVTSPTRTRFLHCSVILVIIIFAEFLKALMDVISAVFNLLCMRIETS